MGVRRFVVFAVAVLLCAACGGSSGDLPQSVTCHTQYRPDAESTDGETAPSLTVERVDGGATQPQRLEFDTLTLEVFYAGVAPEGNNVVVTVATPDGQPLVRDLYQFVDGSELTTDFAGGHGFTGLQYVFHGDASLQVWCEAAEA